MACQLAYLPIRFPAIDVWSIFTAKIVAIDEETIGNRYGVNVSMFV